MTAKPITEQDVLTVRLAAATKEHEAAKIRLATAQAEQEAASETLHLARLVAQSMYNREMQA